MAEPFTLAFVAANCVWGAVKGLSGQAAIAGAKRLAEALRNSQTPENHDVLAATHAAFVRSIQLMADACDKSGSNPRDQFSSRALSKLARAPDFTAFRFGKESLPKRALDASIRSIFQGPNLDPAINAADAVIAQIEQAMREPLTETFRSLFRNGSDKHRSWPQAFELFFAEEVKQKQRVFNILAVDRLNEIVAFAAAHASDLAILHDWLRAFEGEVRNRFDRVDRSNVETRETLARMEAMLAEQTGVPLPTLREIAREFGDVRPDADAVAVESYLRAKAEEYHRYRERSEAIEARDNRSRVLLGQAQEAIDAGHFDEADRLISEAEDHDAEISRELRLTADQRDVDRSAKRTLRGDAAKLKGDYPAAIAHYDAAGEILPRDRYAERVLCTWLAASSAQEWGEQVDPAALVDSIRRWKALLNATDRDQASLLWAGIQNQLGSALACLGERDEGAIAFTEAVRAHRAALEVFTLEEQPLEWSSTQNSLANALGRIGERQEGSDSLHEAADIHRHALKVRTREQYPEKWALTQNNLGIVLLTLSERESEIENLRAAIASLRAALEVRTRKDFPFEWAVTQNNLGSALSRLGDRLSDANLLREAASVLRAAMEIFTRDRFPLQWMGSRNNLGAALRRLGHLNDDTAAFDEAIVGYREALSICTRDRLPIQWAKTMECLAIALIWTAIRTRDCAMANEAVSTFGDALGELGHPSLTYLHAKVERGLAAACEARDHICAAG